MRCGLMAAALMAFVLQSTRAAEPDHAIVPGFERFRANGSKPIDGGRLLLSELGCVNCHQSGVIAGKQGPILSEVGTRVKAGFLKKFLDNPLATKPGTTMPRALVGDPDRAAKIEALVHFLGSTGTPRQERPDLKGIVAGFDLYRKVGCVACHGPRDASARSAHATPSTVPLGQLKDKYTIPSLAGFLENPLHSRPSGRMPRILNGKEARDVANYLLQGLNVDLSVAKGATRFSYYEGQWDKIPDFTRLKPALTGAAGAFDIGVARRGNDYAIKFEGVFKAEREGNYRFYLSSDDGSNLYVDGKKVVDNDGIHPTSGASGSAKLGSGVHQIVVAFFQGGGGAELEVQIRGPGLPQQPLAGLVAATVAGLEKKPEPPKIKSDDDIDIKPELVEKGRTVFASAGCANCHHMNVGSKTIESTLKPATLSKLNASGGCLAGAPDRGVPLYKFDSAQRSELESAIKSHLKPLSQTTGVVKHTMAMFNCYACHSRDKVGGPEQSLNPAFLTAQQEMGDEGRVPPPLDGVGSKLNPDYCKQILDNGSHDRPYMHTRMPGFGAKNVGHLVPLFAEADRFPTVPEVKLTTTDAKVKAAGRFLAGAQALSCFKCHTFNGQKAEGVQGIDMTILAKRLQRDWFQRYLLDPQKVRPGTRMPASWPDGATFYKDLLGGDTAAQIEAIWVYLKDGTSAQPPVGLGKQSIPLVPTTNAIIYRNFIQGAGTRAIGVGYPEKLNLAFDANELRFAMIWQGAFIDAARHWTDRGSGFEGPLGDNILKFPAGAAFSLLDKPDSAWLNGAPKENGFRFLGYRLTSDDRPTFIYSFREVRIEDFPNPTSGKEPALQRTLTLTAANPPANLYFRAAVASKIEDAGDCWFKIDGWKLKAPGAKVRQANGKAELLIPVTFADGKSVVVLEYVW
jgi:mono/diheme cytochrome c family protein/cytochrome c551/c552